MRASITAVLVLVAAPLALAEDLVLTGGTVWTGNPAQPRARAVVQELAAELGLTTSERRSYLELLLASRGEEQP